MLNNIKELTVEQLLRLDPVAISDPAVRKCLAQAQTYIGIIQDKVPQTAVKNTNIASSTSGKKQVIVAELDGKTVLHKNESKDFEAKEAKVTMHEKLDDGSTKDTVIFEKPKKEYSSEYPSKSKKKKSKKSN